VVWKMPRKDQGCEMIGGREKTCMRKREKTSSLSTMCNRRRTLSQFNFKHEGWHSVITCQGFTVHTVFNIVLILFTIHNYSSPYCGHDTFFIIIPAYSIHSNHLIFFSRPHKWITQVLPSPWLSYAIWTFWGHAFGEYVW